MPSIFRVRYEKKWREELENEDDKNKMRKKKLKRRIELENFEYIATIINVKNPKDSVMQLQRWNSE